MKNKKHKENVIKDIYNTMTMGAEFNKTKLLLLSYTDFLKSKGVDFNEDDDYENHLRNIEIQTYYFVWKISKLENIENISFNDFIDIVFKK